MALTERGIRALSPAPAAYEVVDAGSYGAGNLRLRVYPTGRKVFSGVFTSGGKRRTKKLGEYPEMSLANARAALHEWVSDAADTEARSSAVSALTLGEAFQSYMELYAAPRKKSFSEDAARWKRHLVGIEGTPLSDVRRKTIADALDAVVLRGAGVEANRLYALLHKLFQWCVEREMLPHSPMEGLRKPSLETPRERVLDREEIRQLWEATADYATQPLSALLRAILLTGQRPGELRLLRWEYLEEHGYTLPPEATKAKKQHHVPMTEGFRGLLPQPGLSSWVFPGEDGNPLDIHSPGHKMNRISRRCGWASSATAHDLRRTAITCMAEMGVPELVLAAIAGHAVPGITRKVYNRYHYNREKREALEAWQEEIRRLAETG
jgi:integrase